MVSVASGMFQMGSPEGVGENNERPQHWVTLTQNYNIGKYEVTQGQWLAVMGEWLPDREPYSSSAGNDYPAYNVSWNDVVGTSSSAVGYEINGITYYQNGFCYKLSQLAGGGKQYRLPTEAEWEFAARGGNTGKDNNYIYSGSNVINDVAWYFANTNPAGPRVVGGKSPNELGIYDMSGNVSEMCGDFYSSESYTSDGRTNPTGPETGYELRVIRGGSWNNNSASCRVAYRGAFAIHGFGNLVGFRLACSSN